jgi:proton glutamate symport protein
MSLALRVLIGLVLGLVSGIAVALAGVPWLDAAAAAVEPVGALWVNAIRMTVVPLVFSLLVVGIAGGAGTTVTRRIGGGALALFVVFIAASTLLAALAAPPLLGLIRPDPTAVAALRAALGGTVPAAVELPPFRNWLVELVPANPIRAAADGAMLPLVIFTVILGLALARVASARDHVVPFFRVIADAMFVIVGWILAVAPVGVFALVLPLAARAGPALAGALGQGVLVMCALVLVALAALYPVAVIGAGVPLRRFARAVAPAQVVGFGTRSSLASLPALMAGARDGLGLPPAITGLVLPAAVSVFKYASPVARITGTLFIAHLFGIELGAAQVAAIAAALGVLSFYSPGIPSGGLFVMAPIYMTFGLPVEGIGLLIAVDIVVDTLITTANVTANLTVAALLARGAVAVEAAAEPALEAFG